MEANSPDIKIKTGARFVAPLQTAIGASVAVLGVSVIIGWHTGNQILAYLSPLFAAPMGYNTAVCFFITGISFLFLVGNRKRIAGVGGAIVAGFGALTLAQYLFAVNLGIDGLLFKSEMIAATAAVSRMAPNTALCFILCGAAFVFLSGRSRLFHAIAAALGAIVAVISIIALGGYLAGLPAAYTWGSLRQMALATAAGFSIVGAGLILRRWSETSKDDPSTPYLLPVILTVSPSDSAPPPPELP